MGLLGQINGSGMIIKVNLTEIGWYDGNWCVKFRKVTILHCWNVLLLCSWMFGWVVTRQSWKWRCELNWMELIWTELYQLRVRFTLLSIYVDGKFLGQLINTIFFPPAILVSCSQNVSWNKIQKVPSGSKQECDSIMLSKHAGHRCENDSYGFLWHSHARLAFPEFHFGAWFEIGV